MTIRIGTSERAGTFNSQGLALKTIFEKHKSLKPIDVLESNSASIENASRLHAGEIEFGFMASNWIGRAKNGEAPFVQPIDIRMVAPMNAGPMFFITRSDSGIYSVSGLRGRRVAVGMEASGMVQHAHNIFGVLGMTFSDFTPVYLDFAVGAEALAKGEVDAQFQCPIPNKVMTELAAKVDLRVLPYAASDLEALVKAVPYYRSTMMRKGAIRGLTVDVPQIAVVNILATHARMPEAIVRDAVAAILAGAEELGRLNNLFVGLSDLFAPLRSRGPAALEYGGVPLHPGALRAYREAGLVAPAARS
ncbi:MAG TPA: TAXI family TRAP transporter solute-binding subunit [Xanthobacteraceae bacterium]|jgi:TRAP transporter TAXI family solute receptor|nr:TAXI family TRAP transporter solute-binding subunit [Xanthobacteraceae bacterium]